MESRVILTTKIKEMKTITKLEFRLSEPNEVNAIINQLIDKINELTQELNELKFEVAVIHEWKIEKEGI